MITNTDIGKRILSTLRDKGGRLELDHLAHITGASIKEVQMEAKKLESLDLVRVEGELVMLRQGSNFTDWGRLKK